MIRFICPICKKLYKAPDEYAGKKTACKQCGAVLAIPEPAGPSPPPAQDESAGAPAAGAPGGESPVPPPTALVLDFSSGEGRDAPAPPAETAPSGFAEGWPPIPEPGTVTLTHRTGTVAGFHRQTDARTHGGGSLSTTPQLLPDRSARPVPAAGWYASVSGWFGIDTEHIDRCDFWVREDTGRECRIAFPDCVVPVRDGQRVSAVFAVGPDPGSGICVALVNHTAHQVIGVIEPWDALEQLGVPVCETRVVRRRPGSPGIPAAARVFGAILAIAGACLLPVSRCLGAVLLVAGVALALYAIEDHAAPQPRTVVVWAPAVEDFTDRLREYITNLLHDPTKTPRA
jgi:hypothetical protein